jgi:hypothetical protein
MPKRSKNSVSKKTQTKKKSDEDYELPKEPERRFPTNAVVDQNASLLDQHADYLIEMMAKRTPQDWACLDCEATLQEAWLARRCHSRSTDFQLVRLPSANWEDFSCQAKICEPQKCESGGDES